MIPWSSRNSVDLQDVPVMVEAARPHVERYVSDASAFAARKRQQVRPTTRDPLRPVGGTVSRSSERCWIFPRDFERFLNGGFFLIGDFHKWRPPFNGSIDFSNDFLNGGFINLVSLGFWPMKNGDCMGFHVFLLEWWSRWGGGWMAGDKEENGSLTWVSNWGVSCGM